MNVIDLAPYRKRQSVARAETTNLASQSAGGIVIAKWNGFECSKEVVLSLGRIRLRRGAHEMCRSLPNLQKAIFRVASLMTQHHPARLQGGQLLDITIMKAFAAFRRTRDGRQVQHDPQAPLRAILMALLESCLEMADYAVFGETSIGEGKLWPSFEEPISSWAHRNRFENLIFEPRHGQSSFASVRAKVASAALSLTDCMILGSDFDRWFAGEPEIAT